MNKTEKSVLRKVLKHNHAMGKQDLVNGFPDDKKTDVSKAISHLQELGYFTMDLITDNCIISIPEFMVPDALKIVNPEKIILQTEIPKEDLIPKNYSNRPIFIAKGEKLVNGRVSEYWFCSKKKDKFNVTCFVFNKDGISGRIPLGSIFDIESKISQVLKWIDERYKKNPFLKSDLAHNLPEELAGNRQPIKAMTEYLIHENYLVRLSGSKFQRTGKVHQVDTLDEIRLLHEPTKPAVMTTNGKEAYFTEEEGLYVSFY